MILYKFYSEELSFSKFMKLILENEEDNQKILLIDCIEGKRTLPIEFGVENEIVYDIYDYLNGDVDLYKAMVEVDDKISIIASSFKAEKREFDQINLEKLIEEAEEEGFSKIYVFCNESFNQAIEGDKNFYFCDYKPESSGEIFLIFDNRKSALKDKTLRDSFEGFKSVIGKVDNKINFEEYFTNYKNNREVNLAKRSILEIAVGVFTKDGK